MGIPSLRSHVVKGLTEIIKECYHQRVGGKGSIIVKGLTERIKECHHQRVGRKIFVVECRYQKANSKDFHHQMVDGKEKNRLCHHQRVDGKELLYCVCIWYMLMKTSRLAERVMHVCLCNARGNA